MLGLNFLDLIDKKCKTDTAGSNTDKSALDFCFIKWYNNSGKERETDG